VHPTQCMDRVAYISALLAERQLHSVYKAQMLPCAGPVLCSPPLPFPAGVLSRLLA
jgi:hypothetical protein